MIFSKTAEYAIRVMVFLAGNKKSRFSVNRLHETLNIPYKYLGRLMGKLAAQGLVEVFQGKQGGFQIRQTGKPIYLYEIISVVENLEDYDRCILGFEQCSDDHPCSMHQIWAVQKDEIRNIIFNTTLDHMDKSFNIKP